MCPSVHCLLMVVLSASVAAVLSPKQVVVNLGFGQPSLMKSLEEAADNIKPLIGRIVKGCRSLQIPPCANLLSQPNAFIQGIVEDTVRCIVAATNLEHSLDPLILPTMNFEMNSPLLITEDRRSTCRSSINPVPVHFQGYSNIVPTVIWNKKRLEVHLAWPQLKFNGHFGCRDDTNRLYHFQLKGVTNMTAIGHIVYYGESMNLTRSQFDNPNVVYSYNWADIILKKRHNKLNYYQPGAATAAISEGWNIPNTLINKAANIFSYAIDNAIDYCKTSKSILIHHVNDKKEAPQLKGNTNFDTVLNNNV